MRALILKFQFACLIFFEKAGKLVFIDLLIGVHTLIDVPTSVEVRYIKKLSESRPTKGVTKRPQMPKTMMGANLELSSKNHQLI